ncbi:hypothetical protein P5V15_005968 [Pogonomyrmex californicus]
MRFDRESKFTRNTCEPVCKEECVHGKCTDPVAPCTCDDGYKLEGNSAFICSPICNPGCSSHGKCTAPNVCTCNEGYSLKPPNICKPICSQACVRGTCTAPETCSCNTGYGLLENSKYICEPICEKACLNGKCTAPGVCTCNEGFRLSDNETEKHICKPHCEISCGPSGVCIAPDVCNCFKGFHPNKTQIITNSTHYTWNDWVCKPVCETCINGYCNAPGMCSCNIGYQPSGGNDTSVCIPICNQNCVNGFCSEPETCTCNEGYSPFNSSNICEPICETDCINGHCTAPNECTCNSGYQPTEGNHTSLCEPICNPSCKNGICVQPNKCDCNPGYRLSTSLEANTCDPICHPACETNGICKAPDLCVCEDGYRMVFYEEGSVPFKCEPICSVECGNGVCTAPDVCTCFDGYQRAESGGCEPFCSICVNGTCVAPEVCECDDGYSLEEDFNSEVEKSIVPENGTKNGSKCVPRCESCDNGDCVAPGECRCRKGFVKFKGICVLACPYGCDTHGECIDEHRICECHYGWTGLRCDRPIFCVSILNDEGNRTKPLTIIKEYNTTIEYVFINNPVCPECTKKYINNETLCFEMFVNGTKDEKQIGCLMTKDCHALSSPYKDEKKIIILTSGIIVGFGILFLAITIIYLLLRKDPDRQMDLDASQLPELYYLRRLERVGNMFNRMKDCTKLYSQRVPEIYNKTSDETDTYGIMYHIQWTIKHKCCEGYVQSDSQTCVPHCSQSCENGICEKPDVCVCNEGYLKSIDTNGKKSCMPICSNDCINGTCIAPELCSCNENYWLDSDGFTCRPNCNTECEKNYGYCAEPNVCTCRSNYRRVGNDSSPFMCEPVCAVPCKNGHCVAPNVCQCANGYEPDEYDPIFTCKPKCDKPCNGGTCTSPGTCTCDQGYKLVNESFCEPICSEPCQMGTCVAPEICKCKEGYKLRENSKYVCESMCKDKCKNGICAYGYCFCDREYFLNYTSGTCESYCLTHCKPNGTCKSDGTCICPDGYNTQWGTLRQFHDTRKWIKDRNFCEPVCDFKCIKGKCTAPNVCTCNDGYFPSWTEPQNNSDDRICTEFRPCALSCKVNERCDISGSCVCNHGYVKNVFGEGCIPSCTPSCINSNCTEPNRCTCNAGFTPRNESFCEPICKRGCQNGDCISPDHCICHKDFIQNVYNDSGPYCISPCTRNCSEHGECVIDYNLDYKCECHFGWTGEDCDQPFMCVTTMTYDHGDVNRITIRNDTNNTIMQILKSAPNCYQCDSSLNKDTLCYMVHSDKDNTTSVGCLLSTELPCYMTRHYKGSIISTKIVWPFVSIAILLIIGLTVAAFPANTDGSTERQIASSRKRTCTRMKEPEMTDLETVLRLTFDELRLLRDERTTQQHRRADCLQSNQQRKLMQHSEEQHISDQSFPKFTNLQIFYHEDGLGFKLNSGSVSTWHVDATKIPEFFYKDLPEFKNISNRMKDCTKLYSQKVPEILDEAGVYRLQYRIRWTIKHKCCEGYVQSGSQTCVPHCSQSCENGICEKPNVCVCNEGYRKSIDTNGKESCIPICSNDCINGTCIAPELCSCNENYWLDSDGFTCRPNCNTECEKNYGYCAEPNVCTCRSNYRRVGNDSSPFMCEPVCALPCKNGHCVAPNVCQCANGYHVDKFDPIFTCSPMCDKPCNGGTCTSPGTCTCDQGYKLVNESFCEPICSEPCQMGTCVAPEICKCKEGYKLRENSKYVCESMCKNKCGNGTCINGRCFCNREYFLNYTTGTCESYCLTHCKPNGTCNSDGTCNCPDGYSTNFETLKYFHLRKFLVSTFII